MRVKYINYLGQAVLAEPGVLEGIIFEQWIGKSYGGLTRLGYVYDIDEDNKSANREAYFKQHNFTSQKLILVTLPQSIWQKTKELSKAEHARLKAGDAK